MTKTVTSAAEIRERVEAKRYNYFTFPILEITIKYRKPDVLKLALNNALPTVLADQVIKAYKANLEGTADQYQEEAKNLKVSADDTFLTEIRDRGYQLLTALCSSHRIMDVPQSDFDNDVISWNDIPEEDAIAFLMSLLQQAQTSTTTEGGEVSAEDIEKFPNGKRKSKRNTAG